MFNDQQRQRFVIVCIIGVIFVAGAPLSVRAAPGLLAEYSDGAVFVYRTVPTPNFTLGPSQSVHAQVKPAFRASYTGVLKITRTGNYVITGNATVSLNGKNVVGKTIRLASGDHAVKIAYIRRPGPARLQLRWKSDFFVEEPIPPEAFGHTPVKNKRIEHWSAIERGRLLYENLNCASCHGGSGWNLSAIKAPDLSNVGARVTDGWLQAWLTDPRSYRKHATMPNVLSGEKEVHDVAAFLRKLSDTLVGDVNEKNAKNIASGKEIFNTIGCVNCHNKEQYPLDGVGGKFRSAGVLAEFLTNPLQTHPSGRMPQFFDPKTQVDEADVVAEFLFHTKGKKFKRAAGKGEAARGRLLVQSRGCVSCHAIKVGEKALEDKSRSPQFTTDVNRPGGAIRQFEATKGCLADTPKKGTANYHLNAADRAGLRAFMNSVAKHPVVAAAPVEKFYRRMSQFNCASCHSLNEKNQGVLKMTDDGKIIVVERPPPLTGAGDKLRISWIHDVLLKKKRTRPWLKTRMPHFGEAMSDLAVLFPAASGSPLRDESPPPNIKIAKAGLKVIGVQRGKAACITCHDYRGINRQQDGVVPAPDMAEIGLTVRRDWFRRWLHNPTRLQPGTSMPRFFLELKENEKDQKIDELWAALYHQAKLPLPDGLIETETQGTRIVVRDEPVVFRVATILPNKQRIDRAINVGLPGGTNFTFDAKTARLCYAWQGEFINAGPAWNGRGGNPVHALGRGLFTASDQFPLRIGDVGKKPSVRFLGYSLIKRYPVFRYEVDGVVVRERIEIKDKQLVRRFVVANSTKPITFLGDKVRDYSSSYGKFENGVLKIGAGKNLKFDVATPIKLGPKGAMHSLKWNPIADKTKAPQSKPGSSTTVLFENRSKQRIKIFWVAYNGQLKHYGDLAPGGTRSQNTYVHATWLITDVKDRPFGYFVAELPTSKAVISRRKRKN